ncbi:hypothetical protein [Novosphingobium colocasiae]|uniref:DUF7064 domain-containing protein n=1 Tax=Novosphingobium colocasiae TaxID=1256513 RepID=UPI0035B4E137
MQPEKSPEEYWKANDNERWNQSVYFNFYDPSQRTGCFIRVGILENLQESNNWFSFFRDGKPLFTRLNMNLPYTDKRLGEGDGLEIAGMRARSLEPMKKVHITFDERDFKVDLIWEAILPMQDAINLSAGGEDDAFAKNIAHIHMEGTCRVTGTITISTGEVIPIDGKGFRDIAVGPRNWDGLKHYRLAWPIFDNGLALVATHGQSTTGQDAYIKMAGKNGRWIAVSKVEDKNVYEADGMTLERMEWRVTDEEGDVHEFTARSLFRWTFPFDTYALTEHMMEFTLADGTKGYGLGECGFRFPWGGNGED